MVVGGSSGSVIVGGESQEVGSWSQTIYMDNLTLDEANPAASQNYMF